MEVFFTANNIAAAKQPAVLLSCIGSKTYSIVKKLLAPALPSSKPYTKATLNSHFVPKASVISERFLFHRRQQHPGESIAYFVAELHRLAINCKFRGETSPRSTSEWTTQ